EAMPARRGLVFGAPCRSCSSIAMAPPAKRSPRRASKASATCADIRLSFISAATTTATSRPRWVAAACDWPAGRSQNNGEKPMEFGIAVATAADSWKIVKRAEELGFSQAWFYDTQMLCADCFVAMGAAAVNTRRIRLGTGVLVPSNRIAPVAANALASLNKLAPGRIDFGIGTGFTARRAMGFGAIKVKDMETYIHQVYGLLRRETVEFEMEGQKKKIRFLNPE